MPLGRVVAGVAALVVAGSAAGAVSPGPVSITIADARTAERDRGARELVFEVRALGRLGGTASVAFSTAEGTASEDADYTSASGSLEFDRRTSTRTVIVRVRGDREDETDETLRVVLSGSSGATIADGNGVGTIADDDGPPLEGTRIAAAGDIACDPESSGYESGRGSGLECRQLATSTLLAGRSYAAVLALGDIQYEDGTLAKLTASYDPSWGRMKAITRPVPGNHDYETDGAEGYFRYFGASAGEPAKGYYSFDLGGWHLIALNSNCGAVGGCSAGSPQERWLRADLAASAATCTLAYWHHPRFSSGRNGSDSLYAPFWQALYDANADVVLAGHDHHYERFAPQTAGGGLDLARGIRQFVVGTGGKAPRGLSWVRLNSEVRETASLGVLELTLGADAYEWRFRSAVGSFTDSGSATCH
jgi:hypothetical protein